MWGRPWRSVASSPWDQPLMAAAIVVPIMMVNGYDLGWSSSSVIRGPWAAWRYVSGMAVRGRHGGPWAAWRSVGGMVVRGRHGGPWAAWRSVGSMVVRGRHGGTWREWRSVSCVFKMNMKIINIHDVCSSSFIHKHYPIFYHNSELS